MNLQANYELTKARLARRAQGRRKGAGRVAEQHPADKA
jgi:hypothetical protein